MALGARTTAWGPPRIAVVGELLATALDALGPPPLQVVDAGGGTGGFAVPLAVLGHQVLVVDPSPDALAALHRRAAERGVAEQITAVQGDVAGLLDIVAPGSADVVVCHNVLEVVDDPQAALTTVHDALRPGGLASVLVANRGGAVVARALSGRFSEATDLLRADATETDHRFDVAGLTTVLEGAGLTVLATHGIRVFSDLVPGSLLDGDPGATEALIALEHVVATRTEYLPLAGHLHVLARRDS